MATATSTIVFLASPFLIPAVADDQNVSIATAGWVSTTQLAGFVLASRVGSHFLKPVRRLFVGGVLLAVAANLGSALVPDFAVLAGTRFFSGIWLGLAAWFAWQDAFGDAGRTGDVAVIAPLVSIFIAPGSRLSSRGSESRGCSCSSQPSRRSPSSGSGRFRSSLRSARPEPGTPPRERHG